MFNFFNDLCRDIAKCADDYTSTLKRDVESAFKSFNKAYKNSLKIIEHSFTKGKKRLYYDNDPCISLSCSEFNEIAQRTQMETLGNYREKGRIKRYDTLKVLSLNTIEDTAIVKILYNDGTESDEITIPQIMIETFFKKI